MCTTPYCHVKISFFQKNKSLQVLSKQGKMVWGAISVSLHKICWALFLASSGRSKARTHSGKEPQLYQFLREWSGVFHWEIISLFFYIRWDKRWPKWLIWEYLGLLNQYFCSEARHCTGKGFRKLDFPERSGSNFKAVVWSFALWKKVRPNGKGN